MSVVDFDRNGLEVLGRDECIALLGSASVGRIGITSNALLVVLPVALRQIADLGPVLVIDADSDSAPRDAQQRLTVSVMPRPSSTTDRVISPSEWRPRADGGTLARLRLPLK